MKFLVDKDTWQEIYSSIRKNKMRTGITIVGVMWGIFLLVVLLGAARGLENNFNKLFGSFATNSVFVWAQQTSKPCKGFQEGKSLRLKISDVESVRNEIEGLEYVYKGSEGIVSKAVGMVVSASINSSASLQNSGIFKGKGKNSGGVKGAMNFIKQIEEKRLKRLRDRAEKKKLLKEKKEALRKAQEDAKKKKTKE